MWAHNANCTITAGDTEGEFVLRRLDGTELRCGSIAQIRQHLNDHNANPANANDPLTIQARHHTSPAAMEEIQRQRGIDLRTGAGEQPAVHVEIEPFGPTTPTRPGQARTGIPARDTNALRDGAHVDFDVLPNDTWHQTNVRPRNTARVVFNDGRPALTVEGGGMPLQRRDPTFTNVRAQLQQAAAQQPWYRRWGNWLWGLWNS